MATEYKPGDVVPTSGIYRVTHDPRHTNTPHEVTAIRGEHFPPCNHCGHHPRFVLGTPAKHLSEHEHFRK